MQLGLVLVIWSEYASIHNIFMLVLWSSTKKLIITNENPNPNIFKFITYFCNYFGLIRNVSKYKSKGH